MKDAEAGAPTVRRIEVEDGRAVDTVLFVGPDLHRPGGVATFCRAVFPALGFPSEYFVRGPAASATRAPSRLLGQAGDYATFARRIRDRRYRIVHLNLSLSRVSILRDRGFVAAVRHADRALVLAIHGWNQGFFEAASRSRLGGVRRLLSAAARIFVVNRDAERSLSAAGYRDVVEVVPSALETALVEDVRVEELERVRPDSPVLLFLARLEPSKGVLETIKAFELVQQQRPDAELIVAGDGSAADEVSAYIRRREIKSVRLLGHVTGEAKAAAFTRATVYLLPSTHDEGMPHSLIEAMAFGLPVITTPVAGVRDFFVDGQMGFASRDRSPEHLSARVAELVDDPEARRRIGRYNFAFARARFSAAAIAARFDKTYRRIAG